MMEPTRFNGQERSGKGRREKVTLSRWFFLSTVRTALIPLILVECVFIAIYFFTTDYTKNQNIQAISQTASDELSHIAKREGTVILNRLSSVSRLTDTYRSQVAEAFNAPAELDAVDNARLQMKDGAYVSTADRPEGGAAVFYSGFVPIGEAEKQKAARLIKLQSLMKNMVKSEPLAAAIYTNTNDSLNVIYPFFNVLEQYPMKMDIPSYNFYYEADREHNPTMEVKWTSAYLDPAGNGWMASSIAPVYHRGKLEAVVGIDVTVGTIAKQITELSIPWDGYGLLVSQDGTILALPEQGETDWGLTELTAHHYDEAIKQDTFKPEQFNLYSKPEAAAWAGEIRDKAEGLTRAELGGRNLMASWSTIPGLEWKLLVLAPEDKVYEVANTLRQRLFRVGTWMLAGLIIFYVSFFAYLLWMARRSSHHVTRPLVDMNAIVEAIGHGEYRQKLPEYPIRELNETAHHLVRMGAELGAYQDSLIVARDAAEKASLAKSEFLSRMSHELRTPMNAILGFAQLLEMDLGGTLRKDQVDQVREIIRAGEHLLSLINEVLDLSKIEAGTLELSTETFLLKEMLEECLSLVYPMAAKNGITVHVEGELNLSVTADRTRLKQVLVNLLSNAVKYNRPSGQVRVQAEQTEEPGVVRLTVEDTGRGISEEELEQIFTPFHRIQLEGEAYIEGTGIGLTVAKQIIEGMNGRIGVTSTPGKGSRFWLEL